MPFKFVSDLGGCDEDLSRIMIRRVRRCRAELPIDDLTLIERRIGMQSTQESSLRCESGVRL
jgi:hypothetical protein